jgi:hypothetical protein
MTHQFGANRNSRTEWYELRTIPSKPEIGPVTIPRDSDCLCADCGYVLDSWHFQPWPTNELGQNGKLWADHRTPKGSLSKPNKPELGCLWLEIGD